MPLLRPIYTRVGFVQLITGLMNIHEPVFRANEYLLAQFFWLGIVARKFHFVKSYRVPGLGIFA